MSDITLKSFPKINGFAVRRPSLLPVLGFIALVMAVSLFFVWSRVEATNVEYEISKLQGNLREAQKETAQLRLEAASLRSPERIERVARKELGLRLPAPEQVITVD